MRILLYSPHLANNGMVSIVFGIAPIILGFNGIAFWYYVVLGLAVLAVVGLHKPENQICAGKRVQFERTDGRDIDRAHLTKEAT